jgi:nucleoside-diphosphate-sugar epimerase
MTNKVLDDDLDHILELTGNLWEELRDRRLFLTGGTGFFGMWILESFVAANEKFKLNASIVVLTRDANAFKAKAPRLAKNKAIQFHIGDVRDFNFPEGEFNYIIHAAADFGKTDPLVCFNTIVEGTRRTLDFAAQANTKKFLFLSSGAVYGKQAVDATRIPEDYIGAPNSIDKTAAYGEGKRAAEFLCAYYSQKYGIETKIARCFAFVGPYMPLDAHFAIGNFIRDALKGASINIQGDGTPRRSYMYATDLTIWLWTILLRGQSCRAFNVGSEEEISIADLAHMVANISEKNIEIKIAKSPDPGTLVDRYIPSTKGAQTELGLKHTVPLEEAIRKTVKFYSNQSQ